jgi:hypothetical protein
MLEDKEENCLESYPIARVLDCLESITMELQEWYFPVKVRPKKF